jgi:hypothetical protein
MEKEFEVGVASNRIKGRCGEYKRRFCTYRPSSFERMYFQKIKWNLFNLIVN